MKNPWKRLSKVNPQREDGTRQINNHVLDALVKAKLPTAEMSVVLTIISKTWGFNKRSDVISVGQISEMTGFTPRAIKKANAALVKKRIIVTKESDTRVNSGSPLNEYLFNKHYDTWKVRDTVRVNSGSPPVKSGVKGPICTGKTAETVDGKAFSSTRVNSGSPGERRGAIRVNAGTPTKETITKEREIYTYLSRELCDFVVGFIEYISEKKANLAPKSDGLEKKSADAVDKLIRLDGFDLEYIRTVIRWALKDDFWGDKIFSLSSLRKKNDDGITKFQNIANKYESKKSRQPRPLNGSPRPTRSEENAQACQEFINDMMQECGLDE